MSELPAVTVERIECAITTVADMMVRHDMDLSETIRFLEAERDKLHRKTTDMDYAKQIVARMDVTKEATSPIGKSRKLLKSLKGECPERQRGRTVNPLRYRFVGSSPTSPTSVFNDLAGQCGLGVSCG